MLSFSPISADATSSLSPSVASINATLSYTEIGDTLVSATTEVAGASATITEAAETVSSTVSLAIAATYTITEASEVVSSTGTVSIQVTYNVTESPDTVSSGVTIPAICTFVASELPETLTGVGTLAIAISSTLSEVPDSISSTAGAPAIIANVSATEAAETLSSFVVSNITALCTLAEQNETVSATGTVANLATITVTVNYTELPDALVSSGTVVDYVAYIPSVTRTTVIRRER